MHMFTYTKFEAICIALRTHKKAAGRHADGGSAGNSLAGGGDAYVYVHIFFATHNQHANSSGQAAGKKNKKMHTLYIH